MTNYREIDANLFSNHHGMGHGHEISGTLHFSGTGKLPWINLGVWEQQNFNDYELACTNMAKRLMLLRDKNKTETRKKILDAGCGQGASLLYWLNEGYASNVIGVTISKNEALIAEKLIRHYHQDEHCKVIAGDVVQLARFWGKENKQESFDTIICLDSAYHFQTRMDFFSFLSKNENPALLKQKGELLCADILLSEDWASRGASSSRWWVSIIRGLFLRFVSWSAGAPIENLSYSASGLKQKLEDLKFTEIKMEIITESVFTPFSFYCANLSRKNHSFFSIARWSLLGASWYMQMLAYSGGVDFVIYSALKP